MGYEQRTPDSIARAFESSPALMMLVAYVVPVLTIGLWRATRKQQPSSALA
jgi:hypothetical protein